jgi:hypothetical protein
VLSAPHDTRRGLSHQLYDGRPPMMSKLREGQFFKPAKSLINRPPCERIRILFPILEHLVQGSTHSVMAEDVLGGRERPFDGGDTPLVQLFKLSPSPGSRDEDEHFETAVGTLYR